ncbi:MAG: O-antigen ligase family protein [Candidatus Peregrinibacteria bacterium]
MFFRYQPNHLSVLHAFLVKHQRKILFVVFSLFLAFVILWKGGKGLEAVWVLTAVAWGVVYFRWKSPLEGERAVPVPLWAGTMLLLFWTGISFAFSKTANYGLDEVLRTGSVLLLFLSVYACLPAVWPEDDVLLKKCATVVVGIALLALCIGAVVYVMQPVDRFTGTFFDWRFHTDYWPNAWAEFLLLVWPLALWRALKEEREWKSLLWYAVLGVMFSSLLLSYSRGAMLACVGQIILFGVIAYRRRSVFASWRQAAMKCALIVACALALFFSMNHLRGRIYPVTNIVEKATFTAAEGSSSVSERSSFWMQALRLAYREPITGWGPGSFRFTHSRLMKDVLATSDHPHNVLLKAAAEEGLIAAFLLAAIILSILLKAFGKALRDPWGGSFVYLFLAVVGVFAHNLIDYNLQFVSIAVLFWVMLSLLAATVEWKNPRVMNKKIVRISELLIATVLLAIAILETPPLLLSSLGRHREALGENNSALTWYDYASFGWFPRDMFLSRTKILYEEKRYNEAQSAIDDYFSKNRQDARAWRREGDIFLAFGRTEDALTAYETAYKLSPLTEVGIVHAVVTTLEKLQRTEEIAARKDEWMAIMARFADAIDANRHFIALSPNVEEFLAFSSTLAMLFPQEAPRLDVLAAKVDHKARTEREKMRARPPGYLW